MHHRLFNQTKKDNTSVSGTSRTLAQGRVDLRKIVLMKKAVTIRKKITPKAAAHISGAGQRQSRVRPAQTVPNDTAVLR